MGIKSLAPFVSWSGQVPAIPARRKGPESRHPACSDPDRILLIRRKANPPLSMTRCSRTIRSASLRPKGQLPMRLTRRVGYASWGFRQRRPRHPHSPNAPGTALRTGRAGSRAPGTMTLNAVGCAIMSVNSISRTSPGAAPHGRSRDARRRDRSRRGLCVSSLGLIWPSITSPLDGGGQQRRPLLG